MTTPFSALLDDRGFVLLDGGLATELERCGHDLNHSLWSARLIIENPQAIRNAHNSYLQVGADCVATASYQASIPGLVREGLSMAQAEEVLRKSVTIAREVRDEFVRDGGFQGDSKHRPLVAASVGPYGAYLADGSEYVGDYDVSDDELYAFHRARWEILHDAEPDVLACETIPSLREAKVLRTIIDETVGCHAWISFSCCDAQHISDGTPLSQCAAIFADCEQVVAVGVNCTTPQQIGSLIECVRNGAPEKHVVVYPNSGQTYDAKKRDWTGSSESDIGRMCSTWRKRGAKLIGGCCGIGPAKIQEMRAALLRE